MAVSYTPGFRHTDWVDNVDRVRAAGDNGFNSRFHALEKEFKQIEGIIKQIGAALDGLSHGPAPKPVVLTLTPSLVPLGGLPWEHVFGGAIKPSGAAVADASGMMVVTLPHGATIQALRACGRKDSGNLSVDLRRQSLTAGSTTELLIDVTVGNGAFDASKPAPAGPMSKVDNEQFRYYLTADLDGATGGAVV